MADGCPESMRQEVMEEERQRKNRCEEREAERTNFIATHPYDMEMLTGLPYTRMAVENLGHLNDILARAQAAAAKKAMDELSLKHKNRPPGSGGGGLVVLTHGEKDAQQDRAIGEGKRRRDGTLWTFTGETMAFSTLEEMASHPIAASAPVCTHDALCNEPSQFTPSSSQLITLSHTLTSPFTHSQPFLQVFMKKTQRDILQSDDFFIHVMERVARGDRHVAVAESSQFPNVSLCVIIFMPIPHSPLSPPPCSFLVPPPGVISPLGGDSCGVVSGFDHVSAMPRDRAAE